MDAVSGVSVFDSEDFGLSQRATAWRQAMAKFNLEIGSEPQSDNFHCCANFISSPMGMNFARVQSSAQTFTRVPATANEAMLVILVLEGTVGIESGLRRWAPAEEDLILVPPREPLIVRGTADFRMLLVSIPLSVFNARMFQIEMMPVRYLKGGDGFGHVLSQFLAAIAQTVDRLVPEELRPTDLLLAELLIAAANKETDAAAGKVSNAQSMVLQRVCRNIEAQLSDTDLTLPKIAKQENLSPRYLQKLFEGGGDSFSHYVLDRRLCRAKEYLENEQFNRFSISEICFMWGFRDLARFSRSFRERFGESPTDFRRGVLTPKLDPLRKAVRGWPTRAVALKRSRAGESVKDGLCVRGPDFVKDQEPKSHYVSATADTVHWGYFSRSLAPLFEVQSGDFVTIETLTQHAYDDHERMIKGDAGAEGVFEWTESKKRIDRRGAGPMDASIHGRGAGEGFGVQIMTGPIAVRDAQPGDVLEVRIVDIEPRKSGNPAFKGRCFGSNASAWWGFHYKELLSGPKPRETVTIYEIDFDADPPSAHAVYNYRWTKQIDPFGVEHETMDYPGIPVAHDGLEKIESFLSGAKIPLRPHFGVIGVAPKELGIVDSIPPAYFGGNLDNWRAGKGASVFLPVSVAGALLSVGDPHAAQGDSELGGTAIECSMTGKFQIILHKKSESKGLPFQDLFYPLIETRDQWIVQGFSYPNYLAELGAGAQSAVYSQSSIDLAMKDAFRKVRRFLMTGANFSEDEAISFMSVAVDFGISQVVDGNWAVHAIVPKEALPPRGMRVEK